MTLDSQTLIVGENGKGEAMRQRIKAGIIYVALSASPLLVVSSALAEKVVTYYYSDGNGNVLAAADVNGVVKSSLDYHSFGEPATSAADDGPSFAGHYRDSETDLVYMQARFYDVATSRFVSNDPVKLRPGDIFNFNRQSYANNNPYRFVDPDGRQVVGSAEVARGSYITPEVSSYFMESQLCGCDPDFRPPSGSGAVQTVVTPFEFGAARGVVSVADLAFNASKAIVPSAEVKVTRLVIDAGATRNSPSQIRTSISSENAQRTLASNGFTRTTSKDGSVVMLQKDGAKYTFYDKATSTGGASASVQIDGQTVAKIRFDERIN